MDWVLSVAGEALAALLAAVVLASFGWLARSLRELRREIASGLGQADERLDGVDARLVRVETSLGALPNPEELRRFSEALARLDAGRVTHEDLTRVHERLDAVASEVSTLGGRLATIDSNVGLIHKFLLRSK